MKAFSYARASSPGEAAAMASRVQGARFIAGGTNLLDLMKLQIEAPSHLVDLQDLAQYANRALDVDGAGRRRQLAGDEPEEGGLAGAVAADQACPARAEGKVEVAEDGLVVRCAVGDLFERDGIGHESSPDGRCG